MNVKKKLFVMLCVAVPLLFVSGCVRSTPPKASMGEVKGSGFLGSDYAYLKETKKSDPNVAGMAYINQNVNFSAYNKVMVDPVTIWRDAESRKNGLDEDRVQELANYFYGALKKELGSELQLVTRPSPSTLRVQVAITDASGPNAVMDVVSTVVPFGRALSEGKQAVTGSGTFVGEATVELRIVDADNGTLLAAAIDKRKGTKGVTTVGQKSGDVKKILTWWSQMVAYRICQERAVAPCQSPGMTF